MKRDDFIMQLAKLKYKSDQNEFMPNWEDCPYSYARGYINDAEIWLRQCESLGMKPPCLDEDKCEALEQTYVFGGNPYQWDEDFEKDENVMVTYKRRMEFKGLSPTERVQKLKNLKQEGE